MKPFDLEKALAGEPVITRDGKKATEVVFLKTADDLYVVIAVVDGKVLSYTKDGKYWASKSADQNDLFMAPKKVKGWMNVYTTIRDSAVASSSAVYKTRKDADVNATSGRLACIEVEFEEGQGL